MNILIVSVSPRHGSIGNIVSVLRKGYESAGHKVKICYGFHGDNIENGVYHKITPNWEFKLSALLTRLTGLEGIFNPIATLRLFNIIKVFNPDVVHLTNIHAYWLNEYSLLKYLKRNRIPTIYTMLDEYPFLGKCAFSFQCGKYKTGCGNCPDIKRYPQAWFFDKTATIYNWKMKAYHNFENLYMVGGIGVIDKASKAPLLRDHPITMINEPQDFDGLFYYRKTDNLRKNLGIPAGHKVIMCIASLRDDRKGGHYFLNVCKRMKDVPDISFVYVGFNTEKYGKPDNLITIPFVTSIDKIVEFYSMADLLFFGSKADTTPNTILQSLGCGTPVICFDIEGISCMGINDRNVLNMVPLENLNAVEMAFRNVALKTEYVRDKCRKAVYSSFGAQNIVNQYLCLIDNITTKHNCY